MLFRTFSLGAAQDETLKVRFRITIARAVGGQRPSKPIEGISIARTHAIVRQGQRLQLLQLLPFNSRRQLLDEVHELRELLNVQQRAQRITP